MNHDLQDNVVVITGASSGIGRATALEFARKGAHVVVAARRENLLREVFVGNAGRMIAFVHTFAPKLAEPMLAKQIDKGHFKPEKSNITSGTVFEPMQEGASITDGWKASDSQSTRRVATFGVAALVPALIAGAWLWVRKAQA